MSWIKRVFGLYDKKQKKEHEKVDAYIEGKHDLHIEEKEKIKEQSRKIHEKMEELKVGGKELITMVNDVTAQIAKITGE